MSQQGIRARPMSGTQSQGALQQQLVPMSHRKSTSMSNTKGVESSSPSSLSKVAAPNHRVQLMSGSPSLTYNE